MVQSMGLLVATYQELYDLASIPMRGFVCYVKRRKYVSITIVCPRRIHFFGDH